MPRKNYVSMMYEKQSIRKWVIGPKIIPFLTKCFWILLAKLAWNCLKLTFDSLKLLFFQFDEWKFTYPIALEVWYFLIHAVISKSLECPASDRHLVAAKWTIYSSSLQVLVHKVNTRCLTCCRECTVCKCHTYDAPWLLLKIQTLAKHCSASLKGPTPMEILSMEQSVKYFWQILSLFPIWFDRFWTLKRSKFAFEVKDRLWFRRQQAKRSNILRHFDANIKTNQFQNRTCFIPKVILLSILCHKFSVKLGLQKVLVHKVNTRCLTCCRDCTVFKCHLHDAP